VHQDVITQEIREAVKKADESLVVEHDEIVQKRRIGNKRVIIVKANGPGRSIFAPSLIVTCVLMKISPLSGAPGRPHMISAMVLHVC
jgi:hypothetical protein